MGTRAAALMLALAWSVAAQTRNATAPLGREVAISRHMQDGEEFRTSIPDLVEYGRKLFTENWTIQEGAGRPSSTGTGAPASAAARKATTAVASFGAILSLTALLHVAAIAQTANLHQDLLKRTADPIIAGNGTRPLTEALGYVSGRTLRTFIDFGIELALVERDQPMIQLDLTPGLTVSQALDRALVQAPGYDYRAKSPHFISVAPTRLRNDPADILNLKVAKFDVDAVQSGQITSWPDLYIPELSVALHPDENKSDKQVIHIFMGPVGVGPLVTLHLRDVTVREILDAVSIATERADPKGLPLGWLYSLQRKNGSATPHWELFFSAPGNWKELRTRELSGKQ